MFSEGKAFSVKWSADVNDENSIIQTASPGSILKSNSLVIKCTDPDVQVEVRDINVYGDPEQTQQGVTLPTYNGNYETSFYVPTGVETVSSRDKFGQVKDTSERLYKYENARVADQYRAVQQEMEGILLAVWNYWLRHGNNNLKLGLREKHIDPNTVKGDKALFKRADAYIKLLGAAENSKELEKQMIYGYSRYHKRPFDKTVIDTREDEFKEFNLSILRVYGSVQAGFNMVFGKEASVGYVCGVEGAVRVGGENKFPGTCCLDAPYENPGAEWGREHDCNMECKKYAPFFSGLSEESCSAVGGTWCPKPSDCSVLQECVDWEIGNATNASKLLYKNYLVPGQVNNSKSFEDCGSSRSYFGFDPLYKNDADICDNIKQLHSSKDFGFLEEFYTQGTPLPPPGTLPGGANGGSFYKQGANDYKHERIKTDLWDDLKDPETTMSESRGVKQSSEQKASLFALEILEKAVFARGMVVAGFKPPDDENGGLIYKAKTNWLWTFLWVLALAMKHAYMTWQFGFMATTHVTHVEPWEDHEILEVQHSNNKKMYEAVRTTFDAVAQHDGNLEALGDLVASLVGFLGNDENDVEGKINVMEKKLDRLIAKMGARMLSSAASSLDPACDGRLPTVTCGFLDSTTPTSKTLLVKEGGGSDLMDVGLTVRAEDVCSEKLDIQLAVFSNEFDKTGPTNAFFALAGEEGEGTKSTSAVAPNLFLNPATCLNTNRTGFCQKSPIGARIYKVKVEATNPEGLSAYDSCQVVVAPEDKDMERELLGVLSESSPEEQAAKAAGTQHIMVKSITYQHFL